MEERTTRVFAAQAYAELGEFARAETQIQSLRDDPNSYGDSVLIEALIEQRRGPSKDQIVGLLRQRLSTAPTDVKILSALFHHLLPLTGENAQEIIEVLTRIAELRQVSPHEIRVIGQAYLLRGAIDDAERAFRSGRKRYPEDARFIFEHAHTLFLRGDGEGAYEAMREYAQLAERDDATYSNIGTLAESTGRLDEAITMFQTAISREKDPAQLGRIHCALFHLRRRRGDVPKEVLRHAVLFGKTTGGDVEKEALFLMMSLMAPRSEQDMTDPEVLSWESEIQSRLAAFSQKYPNFEGLRSIQIPQELSHEEQGDYLLATFAALTLPSQLRSERVELAARQSAWPLATRAAFMDGVKSVFEYWRRCTVSKNFSHSIHIWEPNLDFTEEVKRIDFSRPVCIDLTALLTLNALDLLEQVTDSFPEFVLSRGTLRAIQKERYSLFFPHPLAIRLDEWVTAHRRKIRALPLPGMSDLGSLDETHYRWEGGLWVPRQRTVAELVGDGVGESLLLSAQKDLPFYCDDLSVRAWARDEFHVGAFSTLALIARLREKQNLSMEYEAQCLAKMISLHYRVVPFGVPHLHESLLVMLDQQQWRTNPPLTSDLYADQTLGVLLRQFGERELRDDYLIRAANQWWLTLLQTSQVPEQTTLSLVSTMTYTLSQRSLENVLIGVSADTPQQRIAVIWSFFLVEVYLKEKERLGTAWSILKSVAEEQFQQNEKVFDNLLRQLIPDTLTLTIQQHPRLRGNEKLIALVAIPGHFGEEDRRRFEEKLAKRLLS